MIQWTWKKVVRIWKKSGIVVCPTTLLWFKFYQISLEDRLKQLYKDYHVYIMF